jgi:L-2,4-diaminobutyrate transaminase
VVEAITRQANELAYYHTYAGHTSERLIQLSARLVAMAPGEMRRAFYGVSGSDANETQVKLAWYYNNVLGRPKKKKVISRERSYHGCSIAAGSLTGLSFYHEGFDLPLGFVRHTGAPHYYWGAEPDESEEAFAARRAHELEELLIREGPETVAAFIAEPVLGTGGLIPPPAGYWPRIQEVLRKYDVLLIADEVITGFGRTGDSFGSFTYGIEPDLITLAKGLTSGYVPMSAVLIGDRVDRVLEEGSETVGVFSHGYTYSGHPLAAAAANAALDVVEREDLPGNARRVGDHLLAALRASLSGHPMVGEIRGVGLMVAIEFVEDPSTKLRFPPDRRIGARVSAAALERGLIARALPQGDILGLAPPLVATLDDAELMAELAASAVESVFGELQGEATL